MAKKKKTRKQKILSDLRHQQPLSHSEQSVIDQADTATQTPRSTLFQYTANTPTTSVTKTPLRSTAITDYHYLGHDLRKTAILTGAIVIAQVVLFLLINNNV
jgi:hypothetical protein